MLENTSTERRAAGGDRGGDRPRSGGSVKMSPWLLLGASLLLRLEPGHLTRLAQREAKGLTQTSPATPREKATDSD